MPTPAAAGVAPAVAVSAPKPAPAKPVPSAPTPARAPRVPLSARLAQAGAGIRRTVARVPWQAWRTLAGIVVLGLVWWAIARSCDRPRAAQPEAAPAVRPVTSPVRPAPEPYLD